MKKVVIVIICIIIAISFFVLGFFVGQNNEGLGKEKKLVGTYYCEKWNDRGLTIELKKDMTYIGEIKGYSNGGTWYIDKSEVFFTPNGELTEEQKEFYDNNKEFGDPYAPVKATIVNEGLLINNNIFKKMN